jgi:AraC family transcriptional regulator, exoenzyme S synthesis regulatory protein ExsA
MVIEHKKLDLFGKKTFEMMIVKPPLTKFNLMDNEACFLHIIEGHSITISETDKFSLKSKESILMKCGNYISNMLPSKSRNYFHSFSVHFHLDVLEKIYKNELPAFLISGKTNSFKSFVRIENKSLINHFMEGMKLFFQYPPALINEDLLILKLKEILLLLYQNDESNSIHDILASLFSPVTYTIRQVIEAHLYSNISVDELATLCNMSVSTFKREFNKTFNTTPAVYLKNRKLEKSKELLNLSRKRINEIASECGFNDLSHFSKSFVQKYGKNPSEYRLNQID